MGGESNKLGGEIMVVLEEIGIAQGDTVEVFGKPNGTFWTNGQQFVVQRITYMLGSAFLHNDKGENLDAKNAKLIKKGELPKTGMKEYKIPKLLIRLSIKKQGEQTRYLTLCDTSLSEVEMFVRNVMQKHVYPFETGKVTSVVIRESINGVNGKSVSVSFKGVNPEYTLQFLRDELL